MRPSSESTVETIAWQGDASGHLVLIDQTRLPTELVTIDCRDLETVWEAIRMLRVRGAPAIGIAAAYGVVVGIAEEPFSSNPPETDRSINPLETLLSRTDDVIRHLATSRPTAVNLFWALNRMRVVAENASGLSPAKFRERMLLEAKTIHQEDREMCHAIGRNGARLLSENVSGVLTHCNAGGLATAEYGTALSVFFTAQDLGRHLHVFVDETRPLLQGARLTTWELMRRNIPATLICDSMAAQVMREGRVQAVVTGADRIAGNGDAANKIGTYSLAILARHHDIPFYIAAPSSTFDLAIASGDEIPIEQRESDEITRGFGRQTAPDGVDVYNPAFDVTPAELITAIITERGVIDPVSTENVARHLA